jgi:UDP-N-acetylglucosamine--N-acetylmuramyl-(pentapeptide) pyrophosphoryl-undecaprenol N-acetylglucosamine transferase
MADTFALVCGGGTAGHLMPALAVAEALVERGHPPESIHFVGSRHGLDSEVLARSGFPAALLPGRGLVRRPSAQNLAAAAGLAAALARAGRLVQQLSPRVALSVGGYAGLPGALAAALARVPLVVLNVDSVPGAANRLLGRLARANAVAWPSTPLPRAVVTGAPVRRAVRELSRSPQSRAAARSALGLPEGRRVLGVFGGSLGSARINRATEELATLWQHRRDLAVLHVVGRRDWPAASQRLGQGEGSLAYRAVEYLERMQDLYAAADLVVCRAGASTVAELAVAGVPAVLVPLPGAPGDHQAANARALAAPGAAVVVEDRDCSGTRLAELAGALLADPGRLEDMGRAAAGVGRPGAAGAVADLVERAALGAGR